MGAREEDIAARERKLAERASVLQATAEEVNEAQRSVAQQANLVDAKWRELKGQISLIQEQQSSQAESSLRFMALRLVPIQHAAAASVNTTFFKTPLEATE